MRRLRLFRVPLNRFPVGPAVKVEGPAGGPYTVWFNGSGDAGEQPAIEGHGSGLTPSGSVVVAVSQVGGPGYVARDRFQYVTRGSGKNRGGPALRKRRRLKLVRVPWRSSRLSMFRV